MYVFEVLGESFNNKAHAEPAEAYSLLRSSYWFLLLRDPKSARGINIGHEQYFRDLA